MLSLLSALLGSCLFFLWLVELLFAGLQGLSTLSRPALLALGWITWLDFFGALCAFRLAAARSRRRFRLATASGYFALAGLLGVIWLIGIIGSVPAWAAAWNLAFAVAFFFLGLTAATGPARLVPEEVPQYGGFRGLGPRGYRRSDARVEEEIYHRLLLEGKVDVREVVVEVQGGEAHLSGHVESSRARHAAGALAGSVLGVKLVHNALRVAVGARQRGRAA